MDAGTVIVGAGHGCTGIAAALRAEGYEGPITLLSAEDETPYHRPPLSKTFLKADVDQAPLLRPAAYYRANRIELPGRRVHEGGQGCRCHRRRLRRGQAWRGGQGRPA